MAVRRKVCVTVINDLVTDQRVQRVAGTLVEEGFEPVLIGRKLKRSLPVGLPWKTRRFRMLFTKGPLFYFFYNLRLFFYLLLGKKPELILANDLDTLGAGFLVSRLRGIPLLYDSHEYFTEVPELVGRARVKAIWERIEAGIVPKLKWAMTVSQPIASAYHSRYGTTFEVVRNLPVKKDRSGADGWRARFPGRKILLYQGAVNKGRGIELLVDAMAHLEGCQLIVAGDGDIMEQVRDRIVKNGLENSVLLTGRLKPRELHDLTCQADLGFSMEEDLGLNYRFALPNKLFDYIMAGVPVICSGLPEMRAIVEDFGLGLVYDERDPEQLAVLIKGALDNRELRDKWKTNLETAAKQLNWESESLKLKNLLSRIRAAGEARRDV